MKDVSFIDDPLLRKRVVSVLVDVFDLGAMIEKQGKSRTKSCLRKTMIIYIVSIIEALLIWKLKKKIGKNEVVLSDEMKYFDSRKVYEIGEFDLFVVKGKRETKQLKELDLNRMIGVCGNREIIKNKKLIDRLHKVRKMRNELHIGGLGTARKIYTKGDLSFVFDVLEETVKAVQ